MASVTLNSLHERIVNYSNVGIMRFGDNMMTEITVAIENYNSNFISNFIRENLVEPGEKSPMLALFNEVEVESVVLEKFSLDSQTLDWMRKNLMGPIKKFYKGVLAEEELRLKSSSGIALWDISWSEARKLLPNIKERYPEERPRDYMVLLGVIGETCFQGLHYILEIEHRTYALERSKSDESRIYRYRRTTTRNRQRRKDAK